MSLRLLSSASGVLLLCAGTLNAQFVRGTILGAVADGSDAVIPGAQVTLKNTGTNESKSAVTDEAGAYTFPALLPGVYSDR